jgi:hypothetical protein
MEWVDRRHYIAIDDGTTLFEEKASDDATTLFEEKAGEAIQPKYIEIWI